MKHRSLPLILVPLLAIAIAACGDNQAAEPGSEASAPKVLAPAASDPGLQHIHGLGVSGNTLLIATHSGLWVAPEGQPRARRLGTSRQDIMGFSVLGENRFIGSGHPDPSQDSPPNLGLIESRDAGKTWTNVSLLGDADFHVLQSSGSRVYGFDGIQGRLLVSADSGRSWSEHAAPAPMFSLAIDPEAPDRLVTSTERGLFASKDAGKVLRPLALREQRAGLLAWPATDRLFLVQGDGQVLRSRDGGTRWRPIGSVDGQPAAFIARGSELYAALTDGTVKRSADGGRTWSVRATP